MKRSLSAAAFLIITAGSVIAEEPKTLKPIVVTPSRLSSSLRGEARSYTLLDGPSFAKTAWTDISDVINDIGGIDMKRRGPEGVQADVSIRGTTFEQNGVLVNGVKANDPQTGHFNMDIPLTTFDIERAEIVKGPLSSLYGANSFGGVINVMTKEPYGDGVAINSSGGSYDYATIGSSISSVSGPIKNRVSVEESRSSGYMPETEFNILTLSDSAVIDTPAGEVGALFGYMRKDFGADSFYSNLYSNEDEHTDTRLFHITGDFEKGNIAFKPKLFLRRHKDKFALDRNRPGWQTNYSTNYNYGMDLGATLESRLVDMAYGFELSRDTIDSTNLQTQSRTNLGAYLEVSPKISDKLKVDLSVRQDHFSGFGWECSPSVGAVLAVFENLSLRGLIGRAYRIPTFTDLYYNDAANKGNSNLKPESAWSYEAGADLTGNNLRLSATYFHRDSYDTIDWIRYSTQSAWQASNIGTVDTNGAELYLGADLKSLLKGPILERASLVYNAVDSYAKHDYFSKYQLDYLKQQISAALEFGLFGFKNSWVLNYKKRIGDSGYITVDTRISGTIFKKGKRGLKVFLLITNIFDAAYSEQSNIEMPGRWIKAGGRFEF